MPHAPSPFTEPRPVTPQHRRRPTRPLVEWTTRHLLGPAAHRHQRTPRPRTRRLGSVRPRPVPCWEHMLHATPQHAPDSLTAINRHRRRVHASTGTPRTRVSGNVRAADTSTTHRQPPQPESGRDRRSPRFRPRCRPRPGPAPSPPSPFTDSGNHPTRFSPTVRPATGPTPTTDATRHRDTRHPLLPTDDRRARRRYGDPSPA